MIAFTVPFAFVSGIYAARREGSSSLLVASLILASLELLCIIAAIAFWVWHLFTL